MSGSPTSSQSQVLPAATEAAVEARHRANIRGVWFMIGAVTLLSAMDAMMKWLTSGYSVPQIVFLRGVGSILPLGVYLACTVRNPMAFHTRRPAAHVLRAVVGLGALVTLVMAFARMPLANVVAIAFAAPLFVTVLAVMFLGEQVGVRRWTSTVVGFIGVLIIIQPGREGFNSAAWLALLGTGLYALVQIFLRQMARTETSAAILFYNLLVGLTLSGACMPFLWVTPTPLDWLIFAASGLVGGSGQICMVLAFRHGEVSVVAPLDYLAIIWATLYGYLIWGDIPGAGVWLGTTIVVGSGLYILHRESRLRLPRGLARRFVPRR